jgi:putative endonuclease
VSQSDSHPDLSLFLCGKVFAPCAAMSKRFVYVLRNAESPPRYYTGITSDVMRRHATHNEGHCRHTAKHRPWSIDIVIEFSDERRAIAFERYLKSGSGVAFAHRHLR